VTGVQTCALPIFNRPALDVASEAMGAPIDADNIDPNLLRKLNMNKHEFVKFVEKYNGRVEDKKIPGGVDRQDPESGGPDMVGKKKLQKGKTDGVGNVKFDGDSGEKKDSGAKQTPILKVAPKHQKKLEAYFRAVSEGEKDSETKSPDSEK